MAALTNRYEDDDASHLPPEMKRVGYDADTERYTFREGDDLWLGEPGSLYGGQLKWAGRAPDTRMTSSGKNEDGPDSGLDSSEKGETGKPSSMKSLQEPAKKALPHPRTSLKSDCDNEWGIPASSISAASAGPSEELRDNLRGSHEDSGRAGGEAGHSEYGKRLREGLAKLSRLV